MRNALLFEIHKSVEECSAWVLRTHGTEAPNYPPEGGILPDERQALADTSLSQEAKSGLQKVIASACFTTVYRFFCFVDAIADPEIWDSDAKPWLPLALTMKEEEADEPFRYDLYESYWSYKAYRQEQS